jgi:hypothetical protein
MAKEAGSMEKNADVGRDYVNVRMAPEDYIKYKSRGTPKEKDPYVSKVMEQLGWDETERSYRTAIGSINEAIDAVKSDYDTRKGVVEAYFKNEIGSYEGNHDTMRPVREAAIDAIGGAGKAVEKLARRGAGIPFTFLNAYTGGAFPAADEIISMEPNYTQGLTDLAKQRIAWNIKDQAEANKTRLKREEVEVFADLELEYKSAVEGLEDVRVDIAEKLAKYLLTRQGKATESKAAEKPAYKAQETDPYETRLPPEEMAELEKHIVKEDPYETRLTPEEMAELEKYVIDEYEIRLTPEELAEVEKHTAKDWDINGLPHYKARNGKYERDDIDVLADNLVDAVFAKKEK